MAVLAFACGVLVAIIERKGMSGMLYMYVQAGILAATAATTVGMVLESVEQGRAVKRATMACGMAMMVVTVACFCRCVMALMR